jgi:chorismate mutase
LAENKDLEELRKKINKITLRIISLCGKRLLLAKEIAKIKYQGNMPIENLKVEEELKNKSFEVCRRYGMDENFCFKLLELILDESKRVQRDLIRLRS